MHPDLVKVVRASFDDWTRDGLSFIVTEGLRTSERQAELYKVAATKTLNSRHLSGHAVDLAVTLNNGALWDWPLYYRLAAVMKSNALRLGVGITWGGDWPTFKDGPHYELNWKDYPIEGSRLTA